MYCLLTFIRNTLQICSDCEIPLEVGGMYEFIFILFNIMMKRHGTQYILMINVFTRTYSGVMFANAYVR
jgi:hypothetical protein